MINQDLVTLCEKIPYLLIREDTRNYKKHETWRHNGKPQKY